MYIKKYLFALSAALISLTLAAQTKVNNNSLIWEVSGNGLQKPSYIFGTYHFIGKDFIDTLPGIMACYDKTAAVAGEILMEDMQVMTLKMMPYMTLKNNTLDKLLTLADYEEVDFYLKRMSSIRLDQLKSFKPAMVTMTILSLSAKSTVSPGNPAIDQYFQEIGKRDKKKIIGLETVESQSEILFGAPVDRQREQLLKMLRDPEKGRRENEKLFRYYKEQNLEAFETLFAQTDDMTKEEFDALVNNRNKNWVKQLPAIMLDQPTFVVVGAGHLPGKEGVLNLLKNAGYTVSAVPVR